MKRLIVALLIAITPMMAQADEGVDRETVEQLLEVANNESMIDAMNGEVDQMIAGLPAQLGLTEEEQYLFDNFMTKLHDSMKEEVSWKRIKDPMIEIYMKHYTKKEIEELLAFYRTETGQSLIKKMPLVMRDAMQLSQQMLVNFLPKIQVMVEEMKNEVMRLREKKKPQS